MGLAGFKGKIWMIPVTCPVHLDGKPPEGTSQAMADQVTMFTFTEQVEMARRGHNKSHGAKDAIAGTWSADISVTAMRVPVQEGSSHYGNVMGAGRVVYLNLFPFGTNTGDSNDNCDAPISGYAVVERVSTPVNIDAGTPVEYTATLVSKGMWKGHFGAHEWGGFECDCSTNVDVSSSSPQ